MTATLPVLKVKTNHSEYVIDQNAGTFSRRTVHEHSNFVNDLGATNAYVELYGPKVGESLVIYLPEGHLLRSTTVQSIEEVPNE